MGALIGMITGGALGYAASKYREKEQIKQQFKMNELKSFHDDADPSQPGYDPSNVSNPEWRKAVTKAFGDKEAADAFLMHSDITAAGYQRHMQAQQKAIAPILNMISGGQMSQGASQDPGSAAPTAATGAASNSPGPGQPVSAQAQAPAAPNSSAVPSGPAPQAPATKPADDFESQLQKLDAAKASIPLMKLDPEVEKSLTSGINDRVKHIERLQDAQGKQANFDQSRADRLMMHADNEDDKKAQREMMGAIHQETMAMQEGNKTLMEELAKEHNEDARQAHFATASASLGTQTKNIATMLSAATPADPSTVRTLLNARNAQARTLKQTAEKYGIDYDPEQFAPLTVQNIKSGGVDGFFQSDKPTLAEDTGGGSTSVKGSASAPADPGTKVGELRRNKRTGEYRKWTGKEWAPSDATGK